MIRVDVAHEGELFQALVVLIKHHLERLDGEFLRRDHLAVLGDRSDFFVFRFDVGVNLRLFLSQFGHAAFQRFQIRAEELVITHDADLARLAFGLGAIVFNLTFQIRNLLLQGFNLRVIARILLLRLDKSHVQLGDARLQSVFPEGDGARDAIRFRVGATARGRDQRFKNRVPFAAAHQRDDFFFFQLVDLSTGNRRFKRFQAVFQLQELEVNIHQILAHLDKRGQQRIVLLATNERDLRRLNELKKILAFLFDFHIKRRARVFDRLANFVVRTIVLLRKVRLILFNNRIDDHRGFIRIQRLARNGNRIGVFKVALRTADGDGNHSYKTGDSQVFAAIFDLRIVRIDRSHQLALFRILDDLLPSLIQDLIRFKNQSVRLD